MKTALKISAAALLMLTLAGCNNAHGPKQYGTINGVPVVCRWLAASSFDFSCKMRLDRATTTPSPTPTPIEGECE